MALLTLSQYVFFDCDSVIENFLMNVRSRFAPITNAMASTDGYNVPLNSLRYWKKNVHKTKYFNDFIYFNLRQHTKKTVIINAERESFWGFLRINSFNLKVLYEHREPVN